MREADLPQNADKTGHKLAVRLQRRRVPPRRRLPGHVGQQVQRDAHDGGLRVAQGPVHDRRELLWGAEMWKAAVEGVHGHQGTLADLERGSGAWHGTVMRLRVGEWSSDTRTHAPTYPSLPGNPGFLGLFPAGPHYLPGGRGGGGGVAPQPIGQSSDSGCPGLVTRAGVFPPGCGHRTPADTGSARWGRGAPKVPLSGTTAAWRPPPLRARGWVGSELALKARVPQPVCPYLAGATGRLPPVVWSHSRSDC